LVAKLFGEVTNGAAVAPANASAKPPSSLRLLAIAGKAHAGKDTFYEHVLQPQGFIRLQMTTYRKIWLVSTGQATWEGVFYTKPTRVRKLLQEDITQVRYDVDEEIWLRVLQNQIRALEEIMCVKASGIAVTDLRFLIEMRGIKATGGKILHLKAPDEQANLAHELRGHRSETELDSPEVLDLRDAYLFNTKESISFLKEGGEEVLRRWGWL
jgi:hypothetical protein